MPVFGETVDQNQRTSDTEQSLNGNKSAELENDDGSDSEEEEDLECEDCGKESEDFDLYIEHRGMGGCAFYCNPCGGRAFRTEKDLKSHSEKHCTTCGDEFYPKKVLDAHMRNCK